MEKNLGNPPYNGGDGGGGEYSWTARDLLGKLGEDYFKSLTIIVEGNEKPILDVIYSKSDMEKIKNNRAEIIKIQSFLKYKCGASYVEVNWLYDIKTDNALTEYRKEKIHLPYNEKEYEESDNPEKLCEVPVTQWVFEEIANFIKNKKETQFTVDSNWNKYTFAYNDEKFDNRISIFTKSKKWFSIFVITENILRAIISEDFRDIPTIVNIINQFLKEIESWEKK